MFTEPDLFDLEMELIFEKNWIYACHESEIANNHDFMTMRAGRQPMIITRDGEGKLNALINACQHRGTTLTRVGKGNQSTFTCPFHAWCYKSDGRLVKVKAPGEYSEGFDKAIRGLKKARIESYKGFVYVSLDVNGTDSLEDYPGDAKVFFDMMVAQSPTGELEVLPGKSAYTYDGNWKLQNENGLDGYHVSTVHYNYVATFFLDQISSQLRIIRPIAWNKTEINSFCLGVKGESDADRENRIRQFEDFFNVSGLGTPDDLVEFREAQRGFQVRLERWSDISRGERKWVKGATPNSETIGNSPVMTGTEFTHEGLYVNQLGNWQRFLLEVLARKAEQENSLKLQEV